MGMHVLAPNVWWADVSLEKQFKLRLPFFGAFFFIESGKNLFIYLNGMSLSKILHKHGYF